jgi:hypothetical protein
VHVSLQNKPRHINVKGAVVSTIMHRQKSDIRSLGIGSRPLSRRGPFGNFFVRLLALIAELFLNYRSFLSTSFVFISPSSIEFLIVSGEKSAFSKI